jgi:hypothetical protein
VGRLDVPQSVEREGITSPLHTITWPSAFGKPRVGDLEEISALESRSGKYFLS